MEVVADESLVRVWEEVTSSLPLFIPEPRGEPHHFCLVVQGAGGKSRGRADDVTHRSI